MFELTDEALESVNGGAIFYDTDRKRWLIIRDSTGEELGSSRTREDAIEFARDYFFESTNIIDENTLYAKRAGTRIPSAA